MELYTHPAKPLNLLDEGYHTVKWDEWEEWANAISSGKGTKENLRWAISDFGRARFSAFSSGHARGGEVLDAYDNAIACFDLCLESM